MRRILIVRLDAIGDAILWSGAMAGVRSAFPGASLEIACRPDAAPIFETCPDVDVVHPIDPGALAGSGPALRTTADRLSHRRYDTILHPVRSRERGAEDLVAAIDAPEKIALASDLANCSAEERAEFDAGYTRILPSPAAPRHELERHADVLAGLGVPSAPPTPRVWLTPADRAAADARLAALRVDPRRTIALCPTARWRYKRYPAWPAALREALAERGDVAAVLLLGEADEDGVGARLGATLPTLRVVSAVGATPVREAIALIERARLCVTNDTFAAHAASAVRTPSVAVTGGGHLGRFLPHHPLGAVACRPLPCDGCDWRCRFERTRCILDLAPEVVAEAIRAALSPAWAAADRPRVFTDESSGADPPAWLAARIVRVEVPTRSTR